MVADNILSACQRGDFGEAAVQYLKDCPHASNCYGYSTEPLCSTLCMLARLQYLTLSHRDDELQDIVNHLASWCDETLSADEEPAIRVHDSCS